MSWNLIIHNDGESLGDIGEVTRKSDDAFRGLGGNHPLRRPCRVDGGFYLDLTAEDGIVQDIYTHGGFYHIKQFAAPCKREGWHMADAQEGEDVDLDNPQRGYDEHGG